MTGDLHDFGRQLDDLIEGSGLPAADLVAALDGRADLLRHAAAAPERAVRARRAAALAADRERAVGQVANACHLPVSTVSDVLRGEGTPYGSRRAQVLTEAAQHPALADELAALQRADERRAAAAPPIAPPARKPNTQGITINGK